MSTFSPYAGLPFNPIATARNSGVGLPISMSFRRNPIDVDPITPGTQFTPGIVTPTGPTTVLPAQMPVPSIYTRPGVVDADPFTPGIQSQPGIITATGPTTVIPSAPSFPTGGLNTIIANNISSTVYGGVVDADPFTPGIQTQPGVITATGPSVISSGFRNSNFVGGGMLSSATNPFNSIGNQSSMAFPVGLQGGIIDADPLTPGIQLQPGIVTPTGPSTVISSGRIGTNFASGFVDMDPFTPGIQSQPGTITPTGPSTIVSGGLGAIGQPFGGIVDADPLTPGIQSRPGIVTPVGPSVVTGSVNNGWNNQGCNRCPMWVWPLLGLLLLGGLIGGLYSLFKPKRRTIQTDEDEQSQSRVKCSGYTNENGECVSCPEGSTWNGKTCTYKRTTIQSSKTTVDAEEGQNPSGQDLPSQVGSQSENASGSESKKIPVFVEQGNERGIDSILKTPSDQGVAPTVVSSKPIPSKPSSVIDASSGSASTTDFTSTNVVKTPAVVETKRIAPTYRSSSCSGLCSGFSSQPLSSSYSTEGYSSSSGSSSSSSSSSSSVNNGQSVESRPSSVEVKESSVSSSKDQIVQPLSADPIVLKHLRRV